MKLTIGEKIALLRKGRNITQAQLAEYLYLAPQTVSRWEVGSGAPDISLLPRIAAFFGVSIDELFGLTSLERTEDLVAKYSVLRDDRSFQEAMQYIDLQLQTIDAALKSGAAGPAHLKQDRDRLEAEKAHMWIQQGREAFQRALAIAESFVKKTEGEPEHPWYLPMRLQLDQLCFCTGTGREAAEARREEYMREPDETSLLRWLAIMCTQQDYEAVLAAAETDDMALEMISPPSEKNLPIWLELIRAASKLGETAFIEGHLPAVLGVCGKKAEADILVSLLEIYEGEKLAAVKRRLLAILPEVSLNKYFEESLRKKIVGEDEAT